MNYRIILVLIVICLFATGLGAMNFISAKGLNLEDAYKEGNVVITQQTPAGTVPHEVTIKNKGKNPVNAPKGTILSSKDSQNLVIARDEVVSPNANITVPAYCIEPDQEAIENKKLAVSGLAPQVITEIASSSNPENPSDALNAQLKIWTIVGGSDFNVYKGEVAAVSQKQDISFYDLKGNLSNAKIEVMTKFNLTADQMNNVNINSSILNQSQSFTEQVMNWFGGLGLNL
jgi:hypothetical protein